MLFCETMVGISNFTGQEALSSKVIDTINFPPVWKEVSVCKSVPQLLQGWILCKDDCAYIYMLAQSNLSIHCIGTFVCCLAPSQL